jgi:crotonobetainyl-CoA:carnitine CoA-transferase CaiB-like acyl-CoA transferase
VISIGELEEWQALCALIGREEWAKDQALASPDGRRAHGAEIDRAIAEWTLGRSPFEVVERLQASHIPAGVVQNTEDQYTRDPHLAERGYFETIPHLKKGTAVAPGIPLGLTGTPGRTSRTGAAMGEDNPSVFRDLLGLSEAEYAAYVEAGAIETPPIEETATGPEPA